MNLTRRSLLKNYDTEKQISKSLRATRKPFTVGYATWRAALRASCSLNVDTTFVENACQIILKFW